MVSNQDSTEDKDSEDFSIPVVVDPGKIDDFLSESKTFVLFFRKYL